MNRQPLIFDMTPSRALGKSLIKMIKAEAGELCHRNFLDGESYIRFDSRVENRDVILIAELHAPDCKILPLLFAAKTARSLGASRVGLIAPYLPYMRQDKAFQSGEAVSSHYFAELLSDAFDWLLTIDPHLHRIESLDKLYTLKPVTLSATQPIVSWIGHHIEKPLIIGPDKESHQWASSLAQSLDAPFVVARKTRSGDRSVEVNMPDLSQFEGHVPIIIDDIISTGKTLMKTIEALKHFKVERPLCIAVHALMTNGVVEALKRAGAAEVITTNTVAHLSNEIDIHGLIGDALEAFLKA